MEKDGCNFGRANRYMIGALLAIITTISAYHLYAANELKKQIGELTTQLTAAQVQNGRLEERLQAAQDSLKRIEAKLDKAAARPTAISTILPPI